MLRIVNLIVVLLLVIIGVVFAALNAGHVQLNYYFSSLDIPLSLIMVLSMIVGAILGILACSKTILKARRESSRLRKSVAVAEKEISNLRKIPIKDEH